MNRKNNQLRAAKQVFSAICATSAILLSGSANAQSSSWQVSKFNSQVAAQGGLGVYKTTSNLAKGDVVSGTATLTLVAPFDVSILFVGFGDPSNGSSSSPFQMSLHFEVNGKGVVFDGPASGINNVSVTLPTGTNASGVTLLLSRKLVALKDVPMGTYSDQGQIIITQI